MRSISLIVFLLGLLSACASNTGVPDPFAPGEEVSWSQAIEILSEGNVVEVAQLHDLSVFLTLKDGSRYSTIEPEIDAIIHELDRCKRCGPVSIVME